MDYGQMRKWVLRTVRCCQRYLVATCTTDFGCGVSKMSSVQGIADKNRGDGELEG